MIKIETDRCVIRNFVDADLDEFMTYRNDENWMMYQGFKGLSRAEYSSALIKDCSLEQGMQLAIVLKEEGTVIGDVYLKKEDDAFWLGYTISPSYSRRGFAFEVTSEVINWISNQNINKVYAGVMTENIASIKLLEKLGFDFIEIDSNGEKIYLRSFE